MECMLMCLPITRAYNMCLVKRI
ncbi:hypothetical protein MTR67_023040 [Solanum verrucosum]|uniref:Uncharacterized protein n=1 Tax=Solanum verrucosum TaxID=315347 RepID=A0AAF0QYZ3_SOLVR|nr:hypothetical protein MTR67_023040 [Solanum verrucosum]